MALPPEPVASTVPPVTLTVPVEEVANGIATRAARCRDCAAFHLDFAAAFVSDGYAVVLVTSNLPFLPVLVSVTVSDAVPVSVIAPVLVPVTVLVTVWPFRSRVRFFFAVDGHAAGQGDASGDLQRVAVARTLNRAGESCRRAVHLDGGSRPRRAAARRRRSVQRDKSASSAEQTGQSGRSAPRCIGSRRCICPVRCRRLALCRPLALCRCPAAERLGYSCPGRPST